MKHGCKHHWRGGWSSKPCVSASKPELGGSIPSTRAFFKTIYFNFFIGILMKDNKNKIKKNELLSVHFDYTPEGDVQMEISNHINMEYILFDSKIPIIKSKIGENTDSICNISESDFKKLCENIRKHLCISIKNSQPLL